MKASALLFLMMAGGCTGDLVDISKNGGGADMTMNGTDDMNGTGGGDLAGMMGSDGSMMMQSVKFTPDIESDINTLGCPGCHTAASGRTLVVTGTTVDADYTSFTAQANMGASSPVLIQNLAVAAGGNAAHPTHPFTDTNNATYVKWLGWINAGNPKGP